MQPSDPEICPTCHSRIPEDAPSGLCPACSLAGAATVAATTSGSHDKPPTIEGIAPHFPELEIIELLGAGGMGAVYKARQPQLDRFIALKILSHELSQEPSFVERFNREAKVLARLSHPNIVAVFDFGTAGPYCYLVMEYVDGVNLRQAMRTGGFTPPEALTLVQDICSALQFAHEEGILHRDIKPENVLIDSRGRVKIADFGIAKMVGSAAPSDVTLTLQGSILGSPHYMAPEQIETPGDVDQRADIYSLGVVLYEMLTGELPIGRFALPSEKVAMDQRIDDIVLRTLAKEREARFQSAGEVGTEVATVAASEPPPPTVAAAAESAAGDSGSARFGVLSAILTGGSFVLIIMFFWIWNISPRQSESASEIAHSIAWKLVPTLVTLVPGLISALVGFVLGARAVGEIRKSAGTKGGLGFATFAVVAWPVCFMAVMIQLCLAAPMPGTGGNGFTIAVLLTGAVPLLAAFVLIRGLCRWARGVRSEDGQRHFPGLSGTLLATLGLAILGPVLAIVLPPILAPGPDRAEQDRLDMMGPLIVESKSARANTPDPAWYRGGPEIILPIKIHDAYLAEFRLALYDSEHNPLGYCDIGTWQPTQRRENLRIDEIETCQLRIGTTPAEGGDDKRAVTAVITSNGEAGTLTADTDFAEWNFDVDDLTLDDPNLPIVAPGTYVHRLARQEEMVDGKTSRSGALELEVRVIERQ